MSPFLELTGRGIFQSGMASRAIASFVRRMERMDGSIRGGVSVIPDVTGKAKRICLVSWSTRRWL